MLLSLGCKREGPRPKPYEIRYLTLAMIFINYLHCFIFAHIENELQFDSLVLSVVTRSRARFPRTLNYMHAYLINSAATHRNVP